MRYILWLVLAVLFTICVIITGSMALGDVMNDPSMSDYLFPILFMHAISNAPWLALFIILAIVFWGIYMGRRLSYTLQGR